MRPQCAQCHKPLAEVIESRGSRFLGNYSQTRTGRYGYKGDGTFCRQRCGYEYGLAVTKEVERLRAKAHTPAGRQRRRRFGQAGV